MITQTKNLSEITQQAIDVLFKEVGVANTIRFLNQLLFKSIKVCQNFPVKGFFFECSSEHILFRFVHN